MRFVNMVTFLPCETFPGAQPGADGQCHYLRVFNQRLAEAIAYPQSRDTAITCQWPKGEYGGVSSAREHGQLGLCLWLPRETRARPQKDDRRGTCPDRRETQCM